MKGIRHQVYLCSCERLACTVLRSCGAPFPLHKHNTAPLLFSGQDASVRRRNHHQYLCVHHSPHKSGDVPHLSEMDPAKEDVGATSLFSFTQLLSCKNSGQADDQAQWKIFTNAVQGTSKQKATKA